MFFILLQIFFFYLGNCAMNFIYFNFNTIFINNDKKPIIIILILFENVLIILCILIYSGFIVFIWKNILLIFDYAYCCIILTVTIIYNILSLPSALIRYLLKETVNFDFNRSHFIVTYQTVAICYTTHIVANHVLYCAKLKKKNLNMP